MSLVRADQHQQRNPQTLEAASSLFNPSPPPPKVTKIPETYRSRLALRLEPSRAPLADGGKGFLEFFEAFLVVLVRAGGARFLDGRRYLVLHPPEVVPVEGRRRRGPCRRRFRVLVELKKVGLNIRMGPRRGGKEGEY